MGQQTSPLSSDVDSARTCVQVVGNHLSGLIVARRYMSSEQGEDRVAEPDFLWTLQHVTGAVSR